MLKKYECMLTILNCLHISIELRRWTLLTMISNVEKSLFYEI